MSGDEPVAFYASRGRLLHGAVNIGLAPVLLYLFRVWEWPPAWHHGPVFAVSFALASFYVATRVNRPRLVISAEGIRAGRRFYPAESIVAVQPVLRTLRIAFRDGERIRESVVGTGWASGEDYRRMAALLAERYPGPDAAAS